MLVPPYENPRPPVPPTEKILATPLYITAFGSLAPFVMSQISAVFGGFRWAYVTMYARTYVCVCLYACVCFVQLRMPLLCV